MRNRAGIILIHDGKLALIERHKQGRHYFAFPGGGVDEGETDEQAAVREAEEELGIRVEIVHRAAEVLRNGRRKQVYFLVTWAGGEFGTGTGEEYGEPDEINGTYEPVWMPLEEILVKNVVPRGLAEVVHRSNREGWNKEMKTILEN
ncbi:MAG TPA: NUDIX domain-containing protein [Anaerolineales bacterium]|jgi:8-oxo-dGTP pyrophosphatase MutT (NUDIX family)|nr:DNA mismatch repair protein MutT [Anaerolineae bacterium]HRJ55526.1 NUDIX domain-containing protein [Anaerolineales bacterium]HRK90274.1 NUDIX domain-containing protein [Anaerolineales bacterium]